MSTQPTLENSPDDLLTVAEVAALLRVSRLTVHHWVNAGKLPGLKVGKLWRFRRRDLEAWYESKR